MPTPNKPFEKGLSENPMTDEVSSRAKLVEEATTILKSERKLKALITEVFWRNYSIDGPLEGMPKVVFKNIELGLKNVAFHLTQMYAEISHSQDLISTQKERERIKAVLEEFKRIYQVLFKLEPDNWKLAEGIIDEALKAIDKVD